MKGFAIKAGKILLPYSVRTTQRRAIEDYCTDARRTWRELGGGTWTKCVKVDYRELDLESALKRAAPKRAKKGAKREK